MNKSISTPDVMRITAGISLILMAVIAGISYGYILGKLYLPEAPAITIENLIREKRQFDGLIICSLFVIFLDLLVAWSFYFLLKTVNKPLTVLSTWLRLVYTVLLGCAVFPLLGVQLLISQNNPDHELILFLLHQFMATWSFGLIIFGCHLILLGVIFFQSALPRGISLLTILAGCCYVLIHFFSLAFPSFEIVKETTEQILALPMAAGELVPAIWLLTSKGRKVSISRPAS